MQAFEESANGQARSFDSPAHVISTAALKPSRSDYLQVASRSTAWLLLIAVFAVAVYRAVTQPIAHDEALEYNWFLDGGVLSALRFNSTNHVLFTLLAKPCVKLLGLKEFTLRLPTLFGTALYLIGAFLLSTELFGKRILMLLSLTLLSLNPTTMDFMAAARGYSLGLAFLVAAMYLVANVVQRFHSDIKSGLWRTKCRAISVLLALSVAANLTNLIPAACLGLLLFFVVSRRYSYSGLSLSSFVWESVAPGALAGFLILWPFLIQARPTQFAMGLPAASDSLRDIFNSSFLYKWTGDIYSISLGAVPLSPGTQLKFVSDLGINLILPLLFVFVLIGMVLLWRAKPPLAPDHATVLIFAGTAICSVTLNWVLHVAIRMNYPVARTALYLVPLFSVAAVLVARDMQSRLEKPWFKLACALAAVVVIAGYAASLNTKYFRYNQYDLGSRQLFQSIYTDASSRGLSNVRIAGTWWYQPEIDFYRQRYHATDFAPYDIVDRSYWWNTPGALTPADYNYFVFTPANDPHLSGSAVRVIFHNPAIGVTVEATGTDLPLSRF